MTLESLLSLVSTISSDSTQNIKEIRKELQRLGVSQEKQNIFLHIIQKIRTITGNPKTQASFFRSYYRIITNDIDKDGRDSSIIIELIKQCQKQCTHCYSRSHDRTARISDENLNRIVSFARKNYKHIFLTGGEPTLDPRVFPLAEQNQDVIFFLLTNGSMITPAYAQKLSQHSNVIPLIGIDGNTASTHDAYRGKGSYNEVMNAITHLNNSNAVWGFISLVTEQNAAEVLSTEFLQRMVQNGASIARFLEYIPVGSNPLIDCILSGETYYLLEKRKNEIMHSGPIYMQNISESKCNGLLFFSVYGEIKNCFCFHYAKYNVASGDIEVNVEKTRRDWTSYTWEGECPLYSDPIGFKNHLIHYGWKHCSSIKEPYLNKMELAEKLRRNYAQFLKLNKEKDIQLLSKTKLK